MDKENDTIKKNNKVTLPPENDTVFTVPKNMSIHRQRTESSSIPVRNGASKSILIDTGKKDNIFVTYVSNNGS